MDLFFLFFAQYLKILLMITIEHLRKEFEQCTPIMDVNTTINKGDVICIVGPSGTGKSTFLRMINLLVTPTSGKIYFDGEEITNPKYHKENARKRMSMVFQNYNLFNHLTVIENIVVPQVDILHKSKEEAYKTAMLLLEKVGMSRQYLMYPSNLSGGQKQRVAIARALAMEPEVILFDEPTSALDPVMVSGIKDIMKYLAGIGQTMLIVTHDMELAESVANRVFYMDQGIIYEDDTPEVIFHHAKRARTKAFIESLNVLKTSIHSNYDQTKVDADIDRFVTELKLPETIASSLDIIYDELLYNLLIKKHNIADIRFIVSYDSKKQKLFVNCKYSGEKLNALAKNNEPSPRLMSLIKNIEYNNIKEKNYRNQLLFETKK